MMMDLNMMVSSSFRYVVRSIVLQKLVPFGMQYFPIHLLWRRDEPSDWPVVRNREKQGLERYEYSLFSQNGEDGIIRYIFSEIGFSSRTLMEFGFGVTENNSLRLILKEGFGGVLIDASSSSINAFNRATQEMGIANVKAIQQFLNLGNLKTMLLESGLPPEIDLLSIDVDGNDYWFWKDIDYFNSRVVVIEYNASLGPELSLTVPYDPRFNYHQKHFSGFYHGASLTALTSLATKKGYSLIGCDSSGVNAFFVRSDCLSENLKAVSPAIAFRPDRRRSERGFSLNYQFRIIKDMPYVNVE